MDAKSLASVAALLDLTGASDDDVVTYDHTLPGLLKMAPASGGGGGGSSAFRGGIFWAGGNITANGNVEESRTWDDHKKSADLDHTLDTPSPGIGESVITILTAGFYTLLFKIVYSNASPSFLSYFRLKVNGAVVAEVPNVSPNSIYGHDTIPLSYAEEFAVNDTIELTFCGENPSNVICRGYEDPFGGADSTFGSKKTSLLIEYKGSFTAG